MGHDTNRQKMQPLVALRAIRRLIANPEDTAQVFTVVRALSGPSVEKGFRRFVRLPLGQRVIGEQIDLLDTLRDREALRALPAGSLGRAYLAFVESENLSAEGLVEASETGAPGDVGMNPDVARYGQRLRDQHDLWHTLTGYGRDELGELCLLAFTYAQTRNRGIGFIVLVGTFKMRRAAGGSVLRAVRRGFTDGRRAAWLPGQDWEALLARPLEEVRAGLGIAEPMAYRMLRSEDYAAA
ncbi:MAG: Coq4 family protein [Pseudomonadales bacterium]|jgi:ubiquinone biosynthesis protein COQ4